MRGHTRVLRGDLVLNTRRNGRQRSGTIIKKHKIKKNIPALIGPVFETMAFPLHSFALKLVTLDEITLS